MTTGTIFNQPKPAVHLSEDLIEAINKGAEPYPIPEGKEYGYGTAGVCRHCAHPRALLTCCSSA